MSDHFRILWLLRHLLTWRMLDLCGYVLPMLRAWWQFNKARP